MKSVTLVAGFAAGLLTNGIHALELIKRDGPPAVIALPIAKRTEADPLDQDQLRRRATVEQTLDNFQASTR